MEQPGLFEPITHVDTGELSIEESFEEFHEANPHVYQAIVRLARSAGARGIKKWGINGIFEVLRWESSLKTSGGGWKLNNNYRPFYARMVMENADLEGFFEVRDGRHHVQG